MTAFEEMGVLPEIAAAVEDMDWVLPTDVQAEAIPLILGGGDVLMAAETGSGKTGAFCMPILQIVWETLKDIQTGKATKSTIKKDISPEWLLSFFDRDAGLAVTPDGLRCQSRDPKSWQGVRATKAVTGKGKYYYEATVSDEGLCRVGWATEQASYDLGTCRNGFGFGGTGKKSNCRQFDDYGEAFGLNDVIGCFLDLDRMEIRYSKNGTDLGKAFSLRQEFQNTPFFPAVVLKNAEMSFKFCANSFKYPPSHGFVAISDAPKDALYCSEAKAADKPLKPPNNAPQAIIIEPSRELAEQTLQQLNLFGKSLSNPSLRNLLVVGGVSVKDQITALSSGTDIVCGTPGRLEELINTGQLSLQGCRFFVLDEADGLLNQGNERLINSIHSSIPKITPDGKRLQMIVCSATLHSFEVKRMAERLMHFPTWVDLKGEDAVPETVHHVTVVIDPRTDKSWTSLRKHIKTDGVHARDDVRPGNNSSETLSEAAKMLKGEFCVKAIETHNMDKAIIFCRTKLDCDNLENYFNSFGNRFSCVCLHGDRKPHERKQNLQDFKLSKCKFLICTDVAARGIDIGGLPFLVNVTLPDEKSNYVHRIGRVGRADRMGLAISLVSAVPEKVWYHGNWCSSRGRNCFNTRLTSEKGCCIWYNEQQCLADVEEHLGVTIPQVDSSLRVPLNEFDGKVVYGEKRKNTGTNYETHVEQLAPTVQELSNLEKEAQLIYLKRQYGKEYPWAR